MRRLQWCSVSVPHWGHLGRVKSTAAREGAREEAEEIGLDASQVSG